MNTTRPKLVVIASTQLESKMCPLDRSNFFSKLYFGKTTWKPPSIILTVLSSFNFEWLKSRSMPSLLKSSQCVKNQVYWNNFFLAQQFFFWLIYQQPWHANFNGYGIEMFIVWWNWTEMQYWGNYRKFYIGIDACK